MAKDELHILIAREETAGTPLLGLGNNSDHANRMNVDEIIDILELKGIKSREVSCYGMSAKDENNLDAVLLWLAKHASRQPTSQATIFRLVGLSSSRLLEQGDLPNLTERSPETCR